MPISLVDILLSRNPIPMQTKRNCKHSSDLTNASNIEQQRTSIYDSLKPNINYDKDQEMNLFSELGRFESSKIAYALES